MFGIVAALIGVPLRVIGKYRNQRSLAPVNLNLAPAPAPAPVPSIPSNGPLPSPIQQLETLPGQVQDDADDQLQGIWTFLRKDMEEAGPKTSPNPGVGTVAPSINSFQKIHIQRWNPNIANTCGLFFILISFGSIFIPIILTVTGWIQSAPVMKLLSFLASFFIPSILVPIIFYLCKPKALLCLLDMTDLRSMFPF